MARKKERSKINLIIGVSVAFIIIVAAVYGLVLLSNSSNQKPSEFISGEIKNTSIAMGVKDPKTNESKTYYGNIIEGENVFTYMKNLQEQNKDFTFSYSESQYGIFVNSINGYSANIDNKEFWELLVNGEVSQVGIADYVIKSGDVLSWQIDNF